MPVAVDQDRTACEGQAPGRTRLVTTLYDLITALHESIEPGEEDLVTAAVVHLLHAGHVKFLVNGQRRDMDLWGSMPRDTEQLLDQVRGNISELWRDGCDSKEETWDVRQCRDGAVL
jgi:hypothetical protein